MHREPHNGTVRKGRWRGLSEVRVIHLDRPGISTTADAVAPNVNVRGGREEPRKNALQDSSVNLIIGDEYVNSLFTVKCISLPRGSTVKPDRSHDKDKDRMSSPGCCEREAMAA